MSNNDKEKVFYDKILLIKRNAQVNKIITPKIDKNTDIAISDKSSQFIIKTRLSLYYSKINKNK
jgi:hypothetical protein